MIVSGMITRKDIRSGRRTSLRYCPLAKALERKGCKYPEVMTFRIWIQAVVSKRMLHADIPSDVGDWIEAYDAGKRVRQKRFRLEFK